MRDPEIIEGNKKIAYKLGHKYAPHSVNELNEDERKVFFKIVEKYNLSSDWHRAMHYYNHQTQNYFCVGWFAPGDKRTVAFIHSHLAYNDDYKWLMPALDEIKPEFDDITIGLDYCKVEIGNRKIIHRNKDIKMAIWSCLVEYLS